MWKICLSFVYHTLIHLKGGYSKAKTVIYYVGTYYVHKSGVFCLVQCESFGRRRHLVSNLVIDKI